MNVFGLVRCCCCVTRVPLQLQALAPSFLTYHAHNSLITPSVRDASDNVRCLPSKRHWSVARVPARLRTLQLC